MPWLEQHGAPTLAKNKASQQRVESAMANRARPGAERDPAGDGCWNVLELVSLHRLTPHPSHRPTQRPPPAAPAAHPPP